MTHSGWGLDAFPDAHLNAIAHAGMDAILLFVEGVDRTPDEHSHRGDRSGVGRYQDVRHLVHRAAQHGLDIYFYSYLKSIKHPDDPDAEDYYDGTYGAIFAACPEAKGVILVGESCEFPSKDPHTTGKLRLTTPADGLPPAKPSPGWWPCYDYPQWLNMLKKVIRKHQPAADIVFWTYNWGYAPEEDRLALIRGLPTDVTLQVTFEMFEQRHRDGITSVCVDYTASFEGPGQYFQSEAEAAHERGIRLYTMCNTGGLTWDFGVIPYEPVPYQWSRRHAALLSLPRRPRRSRTGCCCPPATGSTVALSLLPEASTPTTFCDSLKVMPWRCRRRWHCRARCSASSTRTTRTRPRWYASLCARASCGAWASPARRSGWSSGRWRFMGRCPNSRGSWRRCRRS